MYDKPNLRLRNRPLVFCYVIWKASKIATKIENRNFIVSEIGDLVPGRPSPAVRYSKTERFRQESAISVTRKKAYIK